MADDSTPGAIEVDGAGAETIPTRPDTTAGSVKAERVRRCVVCLATVPPPRRKVCSAHCAQRRELMLQDYRRKHARR